MIRLRVSRRTLGVAVWVVAVPAVIAGLYGLGTGVTPRDGEGRPMLLSPSLRAAEMYRRRAARWTERMAAVDLHLSALLAVEETADATELYAQTQEMQEVGEETADLAREVGASSVPVALVGLREQSRAAADAYLEATLLTARWLSAPSESSRREALEALRSARALRVTLEASRWLSTD